MRHCTMPDREIATIKIVYWLFLESEISKILQYLFIVLLKQY